MVESSKFFGFTGLVALFLFLTILVVVAGGGYTPDFLSKMWLYLLFTATGLVGFAVSTFYVGVDSKYFVGLIHSPEKGFFKSFKLVVNPLNFSLSCFLLFGFAVFFSTANGVFFTSLPQQVSRVANFWAGVGFPSVGENVLFIGVLLNFLLFLSGLFFLKNLKSPVLFGFSKYLFVPLASALVWMIYHSLVYGSDEVALRFTFFFGFVGALLTVLFGSFIPWFFFHLFANLGAGLREFGLLSDELLFLQLGLLWALALVWLVARLNDFELKNLFKWRRKS